MGSELNPYRFILAIDLSPQHLPKPLCLRAFYAKSLASKKKSFNV